jgi:hypothetical protein
MRQSEGGDMVQDGGGDPRCRRWLARRGRFLLLLLLAGSGGLTPTASGQDVEVLLLDGSRTTARFGALEAEDLRLGAGEDARRLRLDDLVSIGFEVALPEPSPDLAEVELANGVRWRGRIRGGRGEELVIAIGAHAELALPYGGYRRVEILSRTAGKGAISPASEGTDRIYRVVGDALDVVDGIVTGYDESGVAIEDADGRERKVAWSETAALFCGSAEPTWVLGERSATIRLKDGSAARGTLVSGASGVLALAFGDVARLEIAPSEVWSVELHGPRFVRLGELEPAKVELAPFFEDGPTPFFVADRGILGAPLRVGGKPFARGLALRPICDLRYDLGGSFRAFRARVGIDDASQPERHRDEAWYGTVRFRIEVDGRELWASPIVRAGQAAIDVPPIDLTGAREIVLRTDFADGLPAGDLPVWIEPILVR